MSTTYADLDQTDVQWGCMRCNMPNISPSFLLDPTCRTPDHVLLNSFDSALTFESPGVPLNASSPRPPKRAKPKSGSLKLLCLNARSLGNKRAQFQNLVDSTNPDVVVVTETWLQNDQSDGEIGDPMRYPGFSDTYDVYRHDRDPKRKKNDEDGGGGVLVAVKKIFSTVPQLELEANCELIWVKLLFDGSKPLYVGGFYRNSVRTWKASKSSESHWTASRTPKPISGSLVTSTSRVSTGPLKTRKWSRVPRKS